MKKFIGQLLEPLKKKMSPYRSSQNAVTDIMAKLAAVCNKEDWWKRRVMEMEEWKKEREDRLKDEALRREFLRERMRSGVIYGCFDDGTGFFLDRHAVAMPRWIEDDIDIDKARAAWRADFKAGIYHPDHYYVSEVFYTEEKKKKIEEEKEKVAAHAAADAAGGSKAKADKSFWPFSLF